MPKRPKGLEATRILSRYALDTYWCPSCNVPIIGKSVCPKCSSRCIYIPLSIPKDVRPAYEFDIKETYYAIASTYGSDVAKRLMPYEGLYLLNKIQHYEAADEVVSGGLVIGVRYYDTLSHKWLFRPDKHGALIIINDSLPGSAISKVKISEGAILSRSDVRIIEEPLDLAEWLVVKDPKGKIGIAKYIRGGKLRVSKVIDTNKLSISDGIKGSTLELAIEVNRPIIEELEFEAKKFLSNYLSKLSGRPLIMLSGGKDSTITAFLASEVGIHEAVFLDTGIEHYETLRQIDELRSRLGLDIIELSAGNTFWRFLRRFGPPARDYRWCTRLVKLAIMAKEFRRLGISKVISITGQRALESPSRALADRVASTGPPNPDGYMLAPIHKWNSLLEHMFIHLKKLPLHKLYTLGFERIGCFLCPSSRLPELEVTSKTENELWNRWLSFLNNYSKRLGLHKVWIDAALWRWRFNYPGDLVSKLRSQGINMNEVLLKSLGRIATIDPSTREVALLEVRSIDLSRLRVIAKVLGYTTELKDDELILRSNGKCLINVSSRGFVRVLRGGLEAFSDAVALIYMSSECLGTECSLCVYICDSNAIRISRYPIVKGELCKSCKKCLRICPLVLKSRDVIIFVKRLLG